MILKYAPTDLREFLQSHFIWKALKTQPNKEVTIGDNKLIIITLRYKFLKNFIVDVEIYMARYFKNIYELFTIDVAAPKTLAPMPSKMTTTKKTTKTTSTTTSETTETTETSPKNLIKRPRLMLFQFPLKFNIFTTENFFLQNQAVMVVAVDALIVDEAFEKYYTENKTTFSEYIKKNYPILVFQDMFKIANEFGLDRRKKISGRLVIIDEAIVEIEKKIADIASEKDDLSFISKKPMPYISQPRSHNSQPINNGIIRMKAEPMTFMYRALTKIQQFCPRLKGMAMEEFQGDSAFSAGLTGEFATYVAALIAENQLTFPNAYKSLATQRHVISHCTNVMNQLKNYTYTKDSMGICCVKFLPPQRKNALTF
jgi:hypothetical protein